MYNTEILDGEFYVNSDINRDQLRQMIAESCGGIINLGSIRAEYIDIYFTKNELYDARQMDSDAGFMHYPHRAEFGPNSKTLRVSDLDSGTTKDFRETFLDMLTRIIIALRESGAQVAVACDYEDLIAERTGTAWNRTTPHHPPVGNGHSKTQE